MPIEDLAAEILTWSDNTAAELLTKEVGRASSGSGTTTAGVTAIQQNLAAQGLPMAGVTMTDGSGLDRGNRVTCELVVDLLDRQGPDSSLADGLSVAGESGTLRDRLRGSALAGRLRAKTGTLSEVNALAGFVTTDDGRELTFAMIVNDDEEEGYQRLDELALALLSATDAPAVEVLGPR
ncbi:MAG: D-alanyl-D-alanine carboxypeptidase/D-alanyl-D-alanine-endopeptidase [Acidimicrobiales bacterium]